MDNENLVLKIEHENWGEVGPGGWQGTVQKIYGDLKMEVKYFQLPTLEIKRRNKSK